MTDRLSELRRQRALMQQHVEWLDREIAACSGHRPAGSAPVATRESADSQSENVARESGIALPDPVQAGQQARRGCFLYLIFALVLLGAVLAAIFHFRYGDRPLLFMERNVNQTGAGH